MNKQVDEYHLYIYNRWGELIFQSHDINMGWDGYINGALAAQGVYFWKVNRGLQKRCTGHLQR